MVDLSFYGELGVFKREIQKIALDVLDEKISLYTLNNDKDYLSQLTNELSFHIASANELVFSEDIFKSFCGIMESSKEKAKFNLAKQIMLETYALSKYDSKDVRLKVIELFKAKEIDIENECKTILNKVYGLDENDEDYEDDLLVVILTLSYYILISNDNIDYSNSSILEIQKFLKDSD